MAVSAAVEKELKSTEALILEVKKILNGNKYTDEEILHRRRWLHRSGDRAYRGDHPAHAVPLNADAMRALRIFRSRGDGTGRVVRNVAGQTLSTTAHWFVPAVRKAKIADFRWHDLRHTFASRPRQAGVPLGNIAELLGHKGLKMTKRYAHLAISNLHAAVALIANSTTVAPAAETQSPKIAYVN